MTPKQPAPAEAVPPHEEAIAHKFSRKTILKDREDALRANLLKRKQQKQTQKQIDEIK